MRPKKLAELVFEAALYLWIVAIIVTYWFGFSWSALLGALACIVLVLRLAFDVQARTSLSVTLLDVIIFAVWLIEAIGTIRSTYIRNTMESFITMSVLISVYYVVRLLMSSPSRRLGLWITGSSLGICLSLMTMYRILYLHIVLGAYHLGNASNLRGLFIVPVAGGSIPEKLSVLLALLPFPLLLAVRFKRGNHGIMILSIISTLLLLVSIALTLSRGMYLGVAVLCFAVVALLLRYSAIPRLHIFVAIAILIVSVTIAVIPWWSAVSTTVLMSKTSMQKRSVNGRAELWQMYLETFRAHPALGIGRGNLSLVPVHLSGRDPAEGSVYSSAFSTPIMLLVEGGVVGLFGYLTLLLCFVYTVMRSLRKGREDLDLLEMSLCFAAILGLCVRDLTTCTVLTQPLTAVLVCVLAGMAARTIGSEAVVSKPDRSRVASSLSRVLPSCIASLFVVTLCVLAWKALQFKRAEARYDDCASALRRGNINQAKSAITDAVNLDGGNALYIAARGLVNASVLDGTSFSWPIDDVLHHLSPEQQKSLELSVADYETVIRLNSGDALAWHNLGWLYFFLGENQQALAALRRSASLEDADWTARMSLGLQLEWSGRLTEAFGEYQEALRLNPHLVDTQFFMELQRRHPNDASAIVSNALATLQRSYTATDSPVLAAKAGKLALYAGDLETATYDLKFATQEDPLLYRAWMNLASAYALQRNRSEAKRCFEIARLLNPLDTEIQKRFNEFNASKNESQNGRPALDQHSSQKVQYLGRLSDRNIKLMREYLLNPEIFNNVVPRGLLLYCN